MAACSLPDLPDTANRPINDSWSQIVQSDADDKTPLQTEPTLAPVSTETEKFQVRVLVQTNAESAMAPSDTSNLDGSVVETTVADARIFDGASATGDDSASEGIEAVKDALEPRVSKQTWRKPSINVEGEGEPQPVMGAVAWPALTEARDMKVSEIRRSKATSLKTSPPPNNIIQESLSKVSLHSGGGSTTSHPQAGVRQKSSFKGNGRPAFQPIENGSSIEQLVVGAHSGPEHSIKHNMQMRMKSNVAVNPPMDHAHYRNDGMGPYPNSARKWRNNNRDQGRGNFGWHQHGRVYENVGDMAMLLHEQRIGPRNMPRPHAMMNMNPAYYPAPNFPNGGMYYLPAGAPDFAHGPPYFPPVGPVMHGLDPMTLRIMLLNQIDYYFSIENLCRDIFLREHMDEQGFVLVSIIARFNRIHPLSSDPMVILEALQHSSVVEVQHDRIRRRNDGGKWRLLPNQVNFRQDNTTFVNPRWGYHRNLDQGDQRYCMTGTSPSVSSSEAAGGGKGIASSKPLIPVESYSLRSERTCVGSTQSVEERCEELFEGDADHSKVQQGTGMNMDISEIRAGRSDGSDIRIQTIRKSVGSSRATTSCFPAYHEFKSRDAATQDQEIRSNDATFSERSCISSQLSADEHADGLKNMNAFSHWMANDAFFVPDDFGQDGSSPSDSGYVLKSHEEEDEEQAEVNDRDAQQLMNVTHASLGSFIAVP